MLLSDETTKKIEDVIETEIEAAVREEFSEVLFESVFHPGLKEEPERIRKDKELVDAMLASVKRHGREPRDFVLGVVQLLQALITNGFVKAEIEEWEYGEEGEPAERTDCTEWPAEVSDDGFATGVDIADPKSDFLVHIYVPEGAQGEA